MLMEVQDAMDNWGIATADTPGAFIDTFLDDIMHMKMEGVLADDLPKLLQTHMGPPPERTKKENPQFS